MTTPFNSYNIFVACVYNFSKSSQNFDKHIYYYDLRGRLLHKPPHLATENKNRSLSSNCANEYDAL